MPVKKRFELVVSSEKSVKDFLSRERCRHRQVTAGEPFCQRHEIRLHAFFVTRKIRTRASKSRHHFIGNQLCALAASHISRPTQPSLRLRDHSCCALHQWLKNERGVGIPLFL